MSAKGSQRSCARRIFYPHPSCSAEQASAGPFHDRERIGGVSSRGSPRAPGWQHHIIFVRQPGRRETLAPYPRVPPALGQRSVLERSAIPGCDRSRCSARATRAILASSASGSRRATSRSTQHAATRVGRERRADIAAVAQQARDAALGAWSAAREQPAQVDACVVLPVRAVQLEHLDTWQNQLQATHQPAPARSGRARQQGSMRCIGRTGQRDRRSRRPRLRRGRRGPLSR